MDWRFELERDSHYEVHEMPARVLDLCFQLLERLGLVYGAFDFSLTPAGEHVFFEGRSRGSLRRLVALPLRARLGGLLMRLAASCAMLLGVLGCTASAQGCTNTTPLDQLIERGSDLYLGEVHGTAEAPGLVECLVRHAVAKDVRPLIVSLELPSSARDPKSDFWDGTDGRASKAMWALMQFLLGEEAKDHLALHFQRAIGGDVATQDELIGSALKDLAQQGLVIALSGNFHSRREPAPFLPTQRPAGMYAGDAYTRISIEAVEGGEAWVCLGDDGCGVHAIPKSSIGSASPGIVADGSAVGHDLAFLVPRFTASPPQRTSPRP